MIGFWRSRHGRKRPGINSYIKKGNNDTLKTTLHHGLVLRRRSWLWKKSIAADDAVLSQFLKNNEGKLASQREFRACFLGQVYFNTDQKTSTIYLL